MSYMVEWRFDPQPSLTIINSLTSPNQLVAVAIHCCLTSVPDRQWSTALEYFPFLIAKGWSSHYTFSYQSRRDFFFWGENSCKKLFKRNWHLKQIFYNLHLFWIKLSRKPPVMWLSFQTVIKSLCVIRGCHSRSFASCFYCLMLAVSYFPPLSFPSFKDFWSYRFP